MAGFGNFRQVVNPPTSPLLSAQSKWEKERRIIVWQKVAASLVEIQVETSRPLGAWLMQFGKLTPTVAAVDLDQQAQWTTHVLRHFKLEATCSMCTRSRSDADILKHFRSHTAASLLPAEHSDYSEARTWASFLNRHQVFRNRIMSSSLGRQRVGCCRRGAGPQHSTSRVSIRAHRCQRTMTLEIRRTVATKSQHSQGM